MTRDFFKGEDSLSSAHDASMVVMNLRRDLLRMALTEGRRPFDVQLLRVGGAAPLAEEFTFDPVSRRFARRGTFTQNPNPVATGIRMELGLFVHAPGGEELRRVTYTYLPAEHLVIRREEDGPEKHLAVPRLRRLDLQALVQPAEEDDALELFGNPHASGGGFTQLWFRLDLLIRSERTPNGANTTPVEVKTILTPKHANRRLFVRWRPLS